MTNDIDHRFTITETNNQTFTGYYLKPRVPTEPALIEVHPHEAFSFEYNLDDARIQPAPTETHRWMFAFTLEPTTSNHDSELEASLDSIWRYDDNDDVFVLPVDGGTTTPEPILEVVRNRPEVSTINTTDTETN